MGLIPIRRANHQQLSNSTNWFFNLYTMKKTVFIIVTYAALITSVIMMSNRISDLNTKLSNSVNNEKAYAAENSKLRESNIVYKLSLEQMEYYQDSLMLEMKHIARLNGIKDKNIKALQYQLEHISKSDTIILKDTIFIQPDFELDTCLIDQWSKHCIHLQYPSTIGISSEYKNDKYVVLDSHKEPIKPRKWFLSRWFSKKHTIVEVTVIDNNPYVNTKQQRFIEVLE